MKLLPKQNIRRTLILGLTSLTVLSVVGLATAQELQRTFTIINPSITAKLDPGSTTEGTTKVINESNVPLTFNVTVQDYIVNDTKGTPQLLAPDTLNGKYSASSWIGVTPSTFTLNPREKQTINYFIQIPKDARPGGHYAALVYQPANTDDSQATGGTVNTQIGSLFYVTVNGPINEKAQVTKFFTNSFQEYGPVKLLTQIKNLGDLHIRPTGTVTVSGLLGSTTQKLTEANIFPETARDFENTVGETFMLGRYKAVLSATYGVNNDLPLTSTLYFWVFPWRLALIILLVIVALVLGAMYIRKRRKGSSKGTDTAKKGVIEDVKETKTVEAVPTPQAPKKVG